MASPLPSHLIGSWKVSQNAEPNKNSTNNALLIENTWILLDLYFIFVIINYTHLIIKEAMSYCKHYFLLMAASPKSQMVSPQIVSNDIVNVIENGRRNEHGHLENMVFCTFRPIRNSLTEFHIHFGYLQVLSTYMYHQTAEPYRGVFYLTLKTPPFLL